MSRFLFNAAVFVEKLLSNEVRVANKMLDMAENYSTAELQGTREQYFKDLINFIFKHNDYYRSLIRSNDLMPKDFKTLDDLKKLPVITKDDIKSNRERLRSNYDLDVIRRTSGGTTGEPIYIDVDKQTRINELYTYYRGLSWMGYRPGESMVKFFGGSLGGNNSPTLKNRIKKFVSGEIFLPAFSLNKENASKFLDIIKDRGETFIQGYVSSIYTLALYAKELNYKGLKIKGAFTTAEQLPVEQADFIKSVFNCDVKGFYGCAEVNSIGFQTKMHGAYVIPGEIVHVETTKHPELGIDNSFLITSLHNKSTPLIRYLNGDNGLISKEGKYYEIKQLFGRTGDMFIDKEGNYISSIVATQTMQVSRLTHKIKRYQFIQKKINLIEFRYQPFRDSLISNEKESLKDIFEKRYGKNFIIEMVETDSFIKSKSNKHRLMVKQLNS